MDVRRVSITIEKRMDLRMKNLLKMHRVFIACFILVALFWTLRVFAIDHSGYQFQGYTSSNSYNSDVVAQQNILKDWQAGYRAKVIVGDDNWFIKYPLYVVTNNLPIGPIGQLLTTILVLMYVTAFILLYSINGFIKILVPDKNNRVRYLALMSIFIAIIPGTAFYILTAVNSRNIEIGLTLFLLLQLHRSLFDKNWLKRHRQAKLVALLALVSCLIANDPLFSYTIVVPIALIAFGLYVFNKLKSNYFWKLAGFIVISFILSKVIKLAIVWLFPVSFSNHTSFIVSLAQFESNINLFLTTGINIFGANLWGDHFRSDLTLIAAIYALILGLAVYFLARGFKRNKNLFYGASIGIFIWTFITFLCNSSIGAPWTIRYLIYMLPIEIIGLLLAVVAIKTARQFNTLLIILSLAFAICLYTTTKSLINNYHMPPNQIDSQVVESINRNGLTKGFGSYWLSGIQTYLSNNKVHEINLACSQVGANTVLKSDPLLSENASFFMLHPKKSFLVYSPIYDKPNCSPYQLVPLLGQPAKVLIFGGPTGQYLAIYNYDISSKVNTN